MKIYLAYRFKEDKQNLRNFLEGISSILEDLGHETFIFFRDAQNWGQKRKMSAREIIIQALKEIKKCDAILLLVDSEAKSEGMLLETGFAKALGKKVFLTIKENLDVNFLRFTKGMADQTIEFKSPKDLQNKIEFLFNAKMIKERR